MDTLQGIHVYYSYCIKFMCIAILHSYYDTHSIIKLLTLQIDETGMGMTADDHVIMLAQ